MLGHTEVSGVLTSTGGIVCVKSIAQATGACDGATGAVLTGIATVQWGSLAKVQRCNKQSDSNCLLDVINLQHDMVIYNKI